MIIKTDPTIRTMQGKFPKSNLIMQNLFGKFHTHAKSYAKPKTANVKQHQSVFSSESKAIFNTFKSASEAFISDLNIYTFAFNRTHVHDDKLPLVSHSIFTALCYKAYKQTSFDLTTLTINNFADLIGTQPTIQFCIDAGFLYHIPDSFYSCFNLQHSIIDGSIIYPSIPDITTSELFLSLIELSTTPGVTKTTDFISVITIIGKIIENVDNSVSTTYSILDTLINEINNSPLTTYNVSDSIQNIINNSVSTSYHVEAVI